MVALKKGSDLRYIHQDHLSSTTLVTDTSGNVPQGVTAMKFYPFGAARSGSVPTDKLFTGQRRDIATAGSELYYYGARYYDPNIARFISPDTIVPNPRNPQSLNRYTYCLNNPLRYIDPTGHDGEGLESPTGDGELGWTSEGGWVIGGGGSWHNISGSTANWVIDNRNTQPSWSDTNWAHLAMLRNRGVEFDKVDIMTPEDFAKWPYPVSNIDTDIYIIYVKKESRPLHWIFTKLFNPSIYADNPNIYVAQEILPDFVQNSLPEEYGHIVQQKHDPNFKWHYADQYINNYGPLFGNSGYWNNFYEIQAKSWANMVKQLQTNP